MANNATRRRKAKGRAAATYLGIPHYVVRSEEFGRLDGWETKCLVEVAAAYNGRNNGDLSFPWSLAQKRGWRSSGTHNKAQKALVRAGWLVITRHGRRGRICNLYAVTWWPIDEVTGKFVEVAPTSVASNAWQKTKRDLVMRGSDLAMRTETTPEVDKK